MITVFVTGASGFIGRAVMNELLKSLAPDDTVMVLVRKPVECADKRVKNVVGDLASLEKVESLVRKADFIIHLAGEARLCGANDYYEINVAPTKQLLRIAKAGGSLQRFIFISSIAAMDRAPSDLCNEPLTVTSPLFPRTGYGTSKRSAEEVILSSDLPYTIFRPGFVYGSGMRNDSHLRKFARMIKKGVPLQWFGFPGKISLIHVDDLATAIAKCVRSGTGMNRTYLAETECMSLGKVLSLLGESLVGRKSFQLHVPSLKYIFQRLHSKLPVIVSGLFLDYYRMDDPGFRAECIDAGQQRSISNNVSDIIKDLPA